MRGPGDRHAAGKIKRFHDKNSPRFVIKARAKWFLTKVSYFSEVFQPLFPNQVGIGLYDAKQLAQFDGGYFRMASGQDRLSGLRQPYLGGVRPGNAFCNMYMNGFNRTTLVKPKENNVSADFRVCF